MLKFTSEADLLRLNPVNPAYPIVSDLVNRIITESYKTAYPYDPDTDGWIALVEEGDLDRPLTEIWGDDAYDLLSVPWEAAWYDPTNENFIHALFIANNSFSIGFVLPVDLLHGELRDCIEAHLCD